MNKTEKEWPWSNELNATIAAPNSHKIRLESDKVRALEVTIPPGTLEPMHTHRFPSVMIVTSSAKIRYWDEHSRTTDFPKRNIEPGSSYVELLEPERLHAVENIDTVTYHAVRIEIKD